MAGKDDAQRNIQKKKSFPFSDVGQDKGIIKEEKKW